MRGHIANRSCSIHGDNGCEIQGEAGSITRAKEKREQSRRPKTVADVDERFAAIEHWGQTEGGYRARVLWWLCGVIASVYARLKVR
jgi:hypothetical protein